MAVIGINYEEPLPDTYESVYIHYNHKEKKEFNTGDFVKDWFMAIKFIIEEVSQIEEFFRFSFSSSVDHFIVDGGKDKYDSVYLKFDEDMKPYLGYKYDHNDEGIELFVKKGTKPTWEELKELIG